MKLREIERIYWERYLQENPDILSGTKVNASIAGNLEIADQLLDLYLEGKKTAGSGLVKDYILSGDELPQIGNHWIILDSSNNPRCIVRTVRVEIYQFDQVPLEVAIAEGEGDLSLDFWRKAHVDFFTPYLKEWGITNLNEEKIVTEFFEVVYKEKN